MLTIGRAAKILGVSIQTLRRWDNAGKLASVERKGAGHRHYRQSDLENYIRDNIGSLDLFKIASNWAADSKETEPFSDFYCPDISVFQARLTRLESELGKIQNVRKIFPLISAITGEIGNNSFDHNLGNWPDIRGAFFAYDLKKGKIVLADRGQGILATLKKVKPQLATHSDALHTAFTEIISGRAPEYRGNGLKFVRDVVAKNEINLLFQTGDARLAISKKSSDIDIRKAKRYIRGCLALLTF